MLADELKAASAVLLSATVDATVGVDVVEVDSVGMATDAAAGIAAAGVVAAGVVAAGEVSVVVVVTTVETEAAVGNARPANVIVAPEMSTAEIVNAAFLNFDALAISIISPVIQRSLSSPPDFFRPAPVKVHTTRRSVVAKIRNAHFARLAKTKLYARGLATRTQR